MQCLTLNECQLWRDEHCHRHAWRRQTTCITPLKQLPWFTATLIEQMKPFDRALLIIDQIVFKPPELEKMRRAAGEQRPLGEAPGHAFEKDPEGFRAALEAAFSGCVDLRAVFAPSKHALSADHDEYTTFFSESSGRIAEVRRVLGDGGVTLVEYTAPAP